jgi:hypothetical protein
MSDTPRPTARLTQSAITAHALRAAIERELPGVTFEQARDSATRTLTFRSSILLQQTVGMTDESTLYPHAEERLAAELRGMIERMRQAAIDATGLQPVIDAQVREAAQRHELLLGKLKSNLEGIERELALGEAVVPREERDWLRAQRSMLQTILAGEGAE